jgi:hypothetical protein
MGTWPPCGVGAAAALPEKNDAASAFREAEDELRGPHFLTWAWWSGRSPRYPRAASASRGQAPRRALLQLRPADGRRRRLSPPGQHRSESPFPALLRPLRARQDRLTSNKHVRDRPEIFAGDEVLTTAIVDRPSTTSRSATSPGRPYRLGKLVALLAPTAQHRVDTRCDRGSRPARRSVMVLQAFDKSS